MNERSFTGERAGAAVVEQGSTVEARGLCKSFSGRRVLNDVGLRVERGEVHALLGMNGSGKSTLVKILSGNYQPEAGEIVVGGVARKAIASPKQAHGLGVRIVHQEAPLIDTMSVAECFALFRHYPTGVGGHIQKRRLLRESRALLQRLEIDIDPAQMAGQLTAAERALVALTIAIGDIDIAHMSLLILDEASASIPEAEADRFLVHVKALAGAGLPVLMVTHRLHEVTELADRTTILHDGNVVFDGAVAGVSREQMADRIAGGQGAKAETPTPSPAAERVRTRPEGVLFSVSELTGPGLDGAELTVAPGEILGVVGGPESGIVELPHALVGALPGYRGRIELDGHSQPLPRSPREALKAGIALVPRDRLREGAVGTLAISENVLLPTVRRYWHKGREARKTVDGVIDAFDVRPAQRKALVRDLSGGNQQKVIIGKWLSSGPRVLVLDDPTSGVDPGARQRIFDVLHTEVQRGLGVILFSTEVEHFVDHCDRIILFSGGRVVDELVGDRLTRSNVAKLAVA
jgi:ribose transport system ATP-binding protein